MGLVCDVLTHLAIGVGNLIGVEIRLGHGDLARPGPKSCIQTATPVRALHAVGPAR
jgi:hypothetical protein